MNHLLNSGNFVGFIGLALMLFVGIRQAKEGKSGGWLLAGGSALFAFSRLYRMYWEPLFQKELHLTFSQFMVTFTTALGAITLVLGFMMMLLGFVFLALDNHRSETSPSLS